MKTKNLHYLTKEFRSIAVAAGLLIAGTAGLLFAGGAQAELTFCGSKPLIAMGGDRVGIDIGEVTWKTDGTNITVEYHTRAPWCMSQVQLHLADSVDGIPQTQKFSPKIGKFEVKEEFEPCSTRETFTVPVLDFAPAVMGDFVIAAHAVVQTIPGYGEPVPGPLDCPGGKITLKHPSIDLLSYFSTTVSDDGAYNGGPYKGWCADHARAIGEDTPYNCRFYNTYDDLDAISTDLIAFPEQFDNVNWLINNFKVGDTYRRDMTDGLVIEGHECDDHEGVYTRGDMQAAIWSFVNGYGIIGIGHGVHHECRAEELYLQALEYGDGYVAGCGDKVSILCEVVNEDCSRSLRYFQPNFFEFPVICGDETAWGKGPEYTEPNVGDWAMYIEASCPTPPPVAP